MLTWFSHDVDDISRRARIFDFLLSHPDPDAVLYLCAALIVQKRAVIISAEAESDAMHSLLLKLGRGQWDIDAAVKAAKEAKERFPRESLKVEYDDVIVGHVVKRWVATWGQRAAVTVIASVAAVIAYGVAANVGVA